MTTLTSLPVELISHVCAYLHVDDVHSLSATSRHVHWALTMDLAKHKALQLQYSILDDNHSKPHTFQFWFNLLPNIMSGSPVASYIRHVRTGYLFECKRVLSPLEMSGGKLEEIDNGWGYNLNLPRLPAFPLSIGGLSGHKHAMNWSFHHAELQEDCLRFRAALEQRSLSKSTSAETPLNLHHFYERLRRGRQEMLFPLLLASLPNLTTLHYRYRMDRNHYLDQILRWTASKLSEGNTKNTAFRNLRIVHITTDIKYPKMLPLLAAFMGLPNITTLSASGVSQGGFERDAELSVSKADDLRLIDHNVSSQDLEKLLEGGKQLKSFRSITIESTQPQYARGIGKVLLANAQSSLEILELSKFTKTGGVTQWGPIQLQNFEKLRELTIEYTYLFRFTHGTLEMKLADLMPRSLEILTLKAKGYTGILYEDVLNMLHRKKLRIPLLAELHLHAKFGTNEYSSLISLCKQKEVRLSLYCR